MRIGDENLFEIGCSASRHLLLISSYLLSQDALSSSHIKGVECPSIGSYNTIGTRARIHYTVRLTSSCTIGPAVLLITSEDETLPEYTAVYTGADGGGGAERRTWSGRGEVQELDLRRKHAEYLRETLPKFNRLRKSDEGA